MHASETRTEVANCVRRYGLRPIEYLESLGCEVYLTRETNDVDISNKERAEFAVSKNPNGGISWKTRLLRRSGFWGAAQRLRGVLRNGSAVCTEPTRGVQEPIA